MTIENTQADIDRFMSKVEKLPCGCWFWTGARSRGKGNLKWYGSFRVGRRVVRAHRFADEVIAGRGPLPPGMHRDHTCEFSLCVNPACTERVTHEENQFRKGYGRPGDVNEQGRIQIYALPGSLDRLWIERGRVMVHPRQAFRALPYGWAVVGIGADGLVDIERK